MTFERLRYLAATLMACSAIAIASFSGRIANLEWRFEPVSSTSASISQPVARYISIEFLKPEHSAWR